MSPPPASALAAPLLREILDHCEEPVAVVDDAGVTAYANQALFDLFGLPVEEILNRPLPLTCLPGTSKEIEILPQRFDRQTGDRPRLVAVRSVAAGAETGTSIVYFRDLSEQQFLKRELRALSLKDELTHLYNVPTFIRFAEHQLELARRMKKPLLLIRVRLAGLAEIAARLGARLADSALVDLAELLVKTFRKSDLLARYGDDEFVVLAINSLPSCRPDLLGRLDGHLTDFAGRAKRPYALQISCGTSSFDPERPTTLEELLAASDSDRAAPSPARL